MNHVKILDQFLKKACLSIYYEIKEAEGTHFTRLYLRLRGTDKSGQQYLFAIKELINFTNDPSGRNSNFKIAEKMAKTMLVELEQRGFHLLIICTGNQNHS